MPWNLSVTLENVLTFAEAAPVARPRTCLLGGSPGGVIAWGGENAIAFYGLNYWLPPTIIAGPVGNAGFHFIDFALLPSGLVACLSSSGELFELDLNTNVLTPMAAFVGISVERIERHDNGDLWYSMNNGEVYTWADPNPPVLVHLLPAPAVRIRRMPGGRMLLAAGTTVTLFDGFTFTDYVRTDFGAIHDVALVTDGNRNDVGVTIAGEDTVNAAFAVQAPLYDLTSTLSSTNDWQGSAAFIGAGASASTVDTAASMSVAVSLNTDYPIFGFNNETSGSNGFSAIANVLGSLAVDYQEITSDYTSFGQMILNGSLCLYRTTLSWYEPPAPPMDPPTLVQHDASIAISWTPYSGWTPDNYVLNRFDNTTGQWFTFPLFANTEFSVSDTDVIDGHNYCYYIRAVRTTGPTDVPPDTYQETDSAVNCIQFYITKPINIDCYTAPGTEIAKIPFPETPLDAFMTVDDRWQPVNPLPGNKAYTTRDAQMKWWAYRLPIGQTTFRFVSTIIDFKTQDVVFRVWPTGKTVADPDASLTQPEKPRPLSTVGWAGMLRERRTLHQPPESSGNR